MNDKDFWQLIFAAAITNNHSATVANGIANDALEYMRQMWDYDLDNASNDED